MLTNPMHPTGSPNRFENRFAPGNEMHKAAAYVAQGSFKHVNKDVLKKFDSG